MVPLLVSGFGRSGTTALMGLLGTDSRVAFDRVYPYEIRYLTYLAKQCILASRQLPGDVHDAFRMCDANVNSGSGPPWWPIPGSMISLGDILSLQPIWSRFVEQLRNRMPDSLYYGEKSPHWLADYVRNVAATRVIHLMREPRDVYLSVQAFTQATGQLDSRRFDQLFEANHARDMAYQLVCFAEAERSDRGRADAVRVRYEDWVKDPGQVASRLSDWLGLKLNAESPDLTKHLDRHRTTKDVKSSMGRWKSEKLPAVVDDFLLPNLGSYGRDYGYDIPIPPTDLLIDLKRPHSNDGVWERQGEFYQVTLRGGDAWIELLDSPIDASRFAEVWLCLRATCGETISAYWCRGEEHYDESRVVHVPFYPGPHVQIVRLVVKKHPMWTKSISRLRIDVCNGAIRQGDQATVFWVRLAR